MLNLLASWILPLFNFFILTLIWGVVSSSIVLWFPKGMHSLQLSDPYRLQFFIICMVSQNPVTCFPDHIWYKYGYIYIVHPYISHSMSPNTYVLTFMSMTGICLPTFPVSLFVRSFLNLMSLVPFKLFGTTL